MSWAPLLECHHGSPVDAPKGVVVYKEVEEARGPLVPVPQQQQQAAQGQQQQQRQREVRAKYVVSALPVEVTSVPPAQGKPNPKLGVGLLSWSPDGRRLASVNENMPHAVWVWDVAAAELASVLLHEAPVRALEWAPAGNNGAGGGGSLAMCTAAERVYLWSPAGASVVHIPLQGFRACGVRWAPDGASLVLNDKEAFCCAYLAG